MKESKWTVAYASVMGNLHVRENIPCQDSCAYEAIDNTYGIAVVADGAGSYSNSHIGSQLSVKGAVKRFKKIALEKKWFEHGDLPTEKEWHDISIELFRSIKDGLFKLAEDRGVYPQSLACTLIVTIHAPNFLLISHIGDGRAGYYNGKEWKGVLIPFSGDEANETVFITSPFWEEADKVPEIVRSYIVKDDIKAFVLMSDGCEKGSFEINLYDEEKDKYFDPNRPYAKFFNPNIKGLQMLKKDGKTQEEINDLWHTFLEKGTAQFQREIDDKTMVLGVLNE